MASKPVFTMPHQASPHFLRSKDLTRAPAPSRQAAIIRQGSRRLGAGSWAWVSHPLAIDQLGAHCGHSVRQGRHQVEFMGKPSGRCVAGALKGSEGNESVSNCSGLLVHPVSVHRVPTRTRLRDETESQTCKSWWSRGRDSRRL